MEYLVGQVNRQHVQRVAAAVLDAVRADAATAWLDAPTDYEDELPDRARAVQQWLQARSRKGAGMGVEVDPSDDEHWDVLQTYAPWSIHVEVYDRLSPPRRTVPLAVLHDGASVITVALPQREAAALAARLVGVAGLIPVQPRRWFRRQRTRPLPMLGAQPDPDDAALIELLTSRDGRRTTVELKQRGAVQVWNIAWGYDFLDTYAHITANCSPYVEGGTLDFFYSSDVERVLDDHGQALYERPGGAADVPR